MHLVCLRPSRLLWLMSHEDCPGKKKTPKSNNGEIIFYFNVVHSVGTDFVVEPLNFIKKWL